MSRRFLAIALGLSVLIILSGIAFVLTSSAALGYARSMNQHKTVGLTRHGIENARQAGLPGALVKMAPQSSLALLKRATKLGPHAQHSTIELTVGLKLRNEARLESFLEQVQNPASPAYHQWLTPEAFTARYGPTKAQVAAVKQFLESKGIKVEGVSSNRILIHTEAATADYERALGIRINDYKLDGRNFYSTADSPKLPRSIAPLVTNVIGLNRGVRMHPHSHFKSRNVAAEGLGPNGTPLPSMTAFNPHQIATAYDWPDITDPANGAGVAIGIVTAASATVSPNGYQSFWRAYDLPAHTVNLVPVGGAGISSQGAIGETLLDIEWSGAMAPGADLIVYNAADTYFSTFTEAYNQLVQDNNVQVMTTSWGYCDAGMAWLEVKTNEQIFAQAAAQGISMFAAAGDAGASDSPPCQNGKYNNADYPSSSAYITAANGTQLTISNLDGTYGHELAWNDAGTYCDNGRVVTGGGISAVIPRPAWQRGPGLPTNVDHSMNSGIAMNASCTHALYSYGFGGWQSVYGTSAVAPMLAGLFAIGVSQRGERLGQSNSLVYNAVNANDTNYGEDFHDVLNGCNGLLPDGTTPSCAGTGWDHPTGWGSPKATSLLAHLGIQGSKGTLIGAVTDVASGAALAGATVAIVGNDGRIYTTTTSDDGSYSRLLPTGSFNVTVSEFGYAEGTASVSIADGSTTTQDFSLSAAPKATLSGKVSDASGHGYGLYADVKISTAGFGQVADVWTDPATGEYGVELPRSATYTVSVAAAIRGYNTASQTVTLSGDTSENFPLEVTGTCTAPGYRFMSGGLGEDFNGATFPPTGWSVTNPGNGPVVWTLTSENPGNTGNYTGGTGTAAEANSINNNFNNDPFDTSLVTPPIAVTSLDGATILRYKANYRQYSNTEALNLDITTDGGASWTNIVHWTTSYGGFWALPGYDAQLDLSSYLPSSGDFQLRWRYYNPSSSFVEYAMIDDVVIGACKPVSGGFVMGQVSDAGSDEGIPGALIVDENGVRAQAQVNLADPDLPIGFYLFFDGVGEHGLTAHARHYSPQPAQINLKNNGVVTQNFPLESSSLNVDPDSFTMHVTVNSSATASFALSNSGAATGRFRIIEINAPPPVSAQSVFVGAATSRARTPVDNPAWIKASVPWIESHAESLDKSETLRMSRANLPGPHAGTAASTWQAIAHHPQQLGIADNTAARDPATGKVYSTGGYKIVNPGSPYAQTVFLKSSFAYDPGTNNWSSIPDTPRFRAGAVSAFLNGKYYVVNGGDATPTSDPVAELDIYDPEAGTWSTGASNPVPTSGGSGYAVLNGRLYIVGGCESGSCATKTSAVQVYDPDLNRWSSAASYPRPTVYMSCGAINGKLYCAGGIGVTGAVGDGYVYDPATNSWSPIADMFFPLGGSFYTAANGLLVVAGGFDSSASIVNDAEAYDPQTDSWIPMPSLPMAVARGAHACGLYQMGGIARLSMIGGATLTNWSNLLPGYSPCGMSSGVPWLATTPVSGALDAGASAKIILTFDGAGQEAFTTSHAHLSIANDSPQGALTVPVTVHWEPQPVSLELTGEVSPDSVRKGGNLTYTLTVQNSEAKDHGAATETALTYKLPDGVDYVASNGDASCTAPTANSSAAPEAVTSGQPGTVTCNFATLDQGASKTVTIAVKAEKAGTLVSHFEVSAREPNDSDSNTLELNTTVIGQADLGVELSGATVKQGKQVTIPVTIANAGPDTATNVALRLSAEGALDIQGASTDQGRCSASGASGYECDLDDLASGKSATVQLEVTGQKTGTASIVAQATTSAEESDDTNNVATASVTVKANDNGGGGALGWFALAALLGLALTGIAMREGREHSGART